ncbi:MAG: carbon storage regulator, partial [Anaerolineaceae bacterium]|nr:carbon storage regulator [Anaerolineaceae bacterium]
VHIGENITVTILGIEGDRVKIGIAAPKEVRILRQEVFQAVLEQNVLKSLLAEGPEPDSFQELRELLAENSPAGDEESGLNAETLRVEKPALKAVSGKECS